MPSDPTPLPDPGHQPDLSPAPRTEPSPPGDATDATTAPLLTLREGLPPIVTTKAQLDEAVRLLARGTGPMAVDAERASGYRYSQRAYLIQLRREGAGTFMIDPLPFGDVGNEALRPLADSIGDAEWILHAASQDLPCLAELGMRPRRLFDTELAGRLLNYPRVGLAILVEGLLGYSMRKEHSAVDWSRRPLPESWLRYAALDVEMLIELRARLHAQLEATGKLEWAHQEFAAWAAAGPPPARSEPWRRTSGIHRVRGRRGLAIVREMWHTRDDLARSRDIAPSKVIRDAVIVETAQAAPTSRASLARLPGFGGRAGQRHVREFAAAVARALALPDAELPALAARGSGPPPARVWPSKYPEAAARLTACRGCVVEIAAGLDLPQENLLEPEVVRRLAWTPPAEPTESSVRAAIGDAGARPWQIGLTAARLAEILRGPA